MPWAAPSQVLRLKTHCAKGHPYTEANTYRKEDGYRRCCECRKIDDRAAYLRRKQAA